MTIRHKEQGRRLTRLALLILLLVTGVSGAWGQTVLNSIESAYVDEANPSKNYNGSEVTVTELNTYYCEHRVGNTTAPPVKVNLGGKIAFYKFDISAYKSTKPTFGAAIFSAQLTGSGDGNQIADIRYLGYNGSWDASTITYSSIANNPGFVGGTVTDGASFQPLDNTEQRSSGTLFPYTYSKGVLKYVQSAINRGDDYVTIAVIHNSMRLAKWSTSATLTLYTANITDVGTSNPNVISTLPTLTGTITSSNTGVATDDQHIKGIGETTFSGGTGELDGYLLKVSGTTATTASTTFATTHKYDEWKITSTGTLPVPTTVALDYVTMSFGYSGETAVSISGNLMKIIDANGYSHANTNGLTLHEDAYGGTFYKFVTTVPGNLILTGNLETAILLTALATSSTYTTGRSWSAGDKSLTYTNLPAGTYYLYDAGVAYLNAFRFALPEQALTDFPNVSISKSFVPEETIATQTITNSSVGGSTVTYSSSGPSVASINASTGALTIHKGGHAVITATAAAVAGQYAETSKSYPVDINVAQKWVFDSSLGATTGTTGLTLVNTNNRLKIDGERLRTGPGCQVKIPNTYLNSNQVVEIIAYAGRSNVSFAITNGIDVSSGTIDGTYYPGTGGAVYRFFVKDDTQDFIIKDASTIETYIRAIYVYTPNAVTNTMVYNAGRNLQARGGSAFITSVGTYHDTQNSSDISLDIYGDLCEFESSNTSLATVNATTGIVTPVAAGNPTITGHAYPTAEWATTYAIASVTSSPTIESLTTKSSKTIAVSDLLYQPMKSSADNGLDRTIPDLTLTITGGDKVMSNGDGTGLTMNGGQIRIEPRYKDGHTVEVKFTYAIVYYADGTFQLHEPVSPATDLGSIFDISEHEKVITHITVEYTSSDGTTATSTLLNSDKTTPTLTYTPATYTLQKNARLEVFTPATTPKNLSGITYTISNTSIVSLTDGMLKAESLSSTGTTLTASFSGNAYFNASANAMATIKVSEATNTATLDVTNKINTEGTATIDGFAFANEELQLHVTVKDETETLIEPEHYAVTYNTSNPALAYINSSNQVVTQRDAEGLVTITAVITPTEGDYPTLTASFDLMVISGTWDFRTFTQTTAGTLSGWTNSGNGHNYTRTTDGFLPVLNTSSEPIAMAKALKSAGHVRWHYNGNNTTAGNFELMGKGKDGNHLGGIIKVPVRKGMLVEVNMGSEGNSEVEMLINNTGNPSDEDISYHVVTDLSGSPLVKFNINNAPESHQFIVNTDDEFLYIVNPSVNLRAQIKYIKLSNQIVFKYGYETYVDEAGSTYNSTGVFRNPIENATTGDTFTYEWEALKTSDIVSSMDADGTAHLRDHTYGSYKVYATAGGTGLLSGVTTSYTAHVIGFTVNSTVNATVADALTWDATALKTAVINSVSSNGLDNDGIKDKVTYSIVSHTTSNATISGITGNQTLVIEGAGNVVVLAKLGAIEREVTFVVAGGDFDNRVPVVSLDDKTYTFKFEGTATSVTYSADDIAAMKAGIIGELYQDKDRITITQSGNNLVIATSDNKSFGHGGIIPIYGSYEYNGNTYPLSGVLTVAYEEHTWYFNHNMLTFAGTHKGDDYKKDYTSYTEFWADNTKYDGLADFYTDNTSNPKTRTGTWTSNASFDEPVDATANHSDSHDWRFIRKMGITHPESDIIYYYNHSVHGTNALVMPETAGLHINADHSGQQFGVAMMYQRENGVGVPVLTSDGDYNMQNVMLKRGGQLVVPHVKPGQWIEMKWTRHTDDLAERLTMENLSDINGKLITEVYKIGNTATGTYMFQVDPSSSEEYLDAKFTVADNVYISIQEVILHRHGWDYNSSMNIDLTQVNSDNTTSPVPYHVLCDGNETTITLANHGGQFAPNAPADWQVVVVGNIDCTAEGTQATDHNGNARPTGYYADDGNFKLKYSDGWGKVYVTLNSYSQNYKYVANRKTWFITFGEKPKQTYPHTWDFTKYFANTKTQVGKREYDDFEQEDPLYDESANRYGAHEYRKKIDSWTEDGNNEKVVTTDYATSYCNSYFVNGAQLVSYGLKDDATYHGRLPETDGLGFILNNLGNSDNTDDTELTLNMANTSENAVRATQSSGDSYQTWKPSGSLTFTGGGSIIVPKPSSSEAIPTGKSATDYYIYVLTSAEPAIADATVIEKQTTDVSETGERKQYRYHFLKDENAQLNFSSNADIYAIAVTNEFKTMTPLTGTAWATESRSHAVDYTLDSLLTINPIHAYAIIERSGNPKYSDDKAKTVVAVNDRRHVVPANNGLVLKQTQRYDNSTSVYAAIGSGETTTYQVPLFAPAVTTAEDAGYRFTGNLMRPCVNGKPFMSETENLDGTDYTVFILANKYMTWKKEGTSAATTDNSWHSGNVAAFYRLHKYGDNATNTLGRNKAYLLLRTDKINDPIWETSPASPAPRYVGIAGVSDMEEEQSAAGIDQGDGRTYNLRGQAVDGESLSPGIYIKNGKKIVMK